MATVDWEAEAETVLGALPATRQDASEIDWESQAEAILGHTSAPTFKQALPQAMPAFEVPPDAGPVAPRGLGNAPFSPSEEAPEPQVVYDKNGPTIGPAGTASPKALVTPGWQDRPENAPDFTDKWIWDRSRYAATTPSKDVNKERTALISQFKEYFPDQKWTQEIEDSFDRYANAHRAASRMLSESGRKLSMDERIARDVKPEDRPLVLAAIQEQASERPRDESYVGRVTEAASKSVMDFYPVRKPRQMLGGEPTPDQAKFLQQARDTHEQVDPIDLPGGPMRPANWPIEVAKMTNMAVMGQATRAGEAAAAVLAYGNKAGTALKAMELGYKGVGAAKAIKTAGVVSGALTFVPDAVDATRAEMIGRGVTPETAKWASYGAGSLMATLYSAVPAAAVWKKPGQSELVYGSLAGMLGRLGGGAAHGAGLMGGAALSDAAVSEIAAAVDGVSPGLGAALTSIGSKTLNATINAGPPMLILGLPRAVAENIAGQVAISRKKWLEAGLAPEDGRTEERRQAFADKVREAIENTGEQDKASAIPPEDVGRVPPEAAPPGEPTASSPIPEAQQPPETPAGATTAGVPVARLAPEVPVARISPEVPIARVDPTATDGVPPGVSVKNAYTDRRRGELNMEPRVVQEGPARVDMAAIADAATPEEVTAVVDRAREDPRTAGAQENLFIQRRLRELERLRTRAKEREEATGDDTELTRAEADLLDIVNITNLTGHQQSISLSSRIWEDPQDISPESIVREMLKTRQRPLNAKERKTADDLGKEAVALKATIEATKEAEAQAAFDTAHTTVLNETTEKQKEATKKRQETIKNAVRQQFKVASEYGVEPIQLGQYAESLAKAEAKFAEEYNAAFRTVQKATGLSPAVIDKIDKNYENIYEYHGLDGKAPQLAREYDILGFHPESEDVQQKRDHAEKLVDILKAGQKEVPHWTDKLEEAARKILSEHGDSWEPSAGENRTFGGEEVPFGAPEPKPAAEKTPRQPSKREAARKQIDVAWRELGQAFEATHTSGGLSPDALNAALKLTKAYVDLGAATFTDFMARLRKQFGAKADKYRAACEVAWKQLKESGEIASPVEDPTDMEAVGRLARKLHRQVVEDGIRDREKAVDAVHEELSQVVPDFTRRQTQDAMSGYGSFKELSKDDISIKVRAHKGELQQVSKIADLQNAIRQAKEWLDKGMPSEEVAKRLVKEGLLPKRTGIERREGTDIERELLKQVNELKKELPVPIGEGHGSLKTALQSAKTAALNQIKDMDKAMATGKRLEKGKTVLIPDAELAQIRKHRQELSALYDKMFPKEPKTEAEKDAATEKMLDRLITQLDADIKSGNIDPKTRKVKRSSPEIDAKRNKLEELRDIRQDLRDAKNPKLSPEERQINAYERSLTKRIANYENRIATKDYAKKTKIEKKYPKKIEDAQFELEKVKDKLELDTYNWEKSQRHWLVKVGSILPGGSNLAKSLLASIDLSAVLRQGVVLIASHPYVGARAAGKMFGAMRSEKAMFRLNQQIAARPNAWLYRLAGLELTDVHGRPSQREEAFRSNLLKIDPTATWDKKPIASAANVARYPFAASDRAYTSFLNVLRADVFDSMVATLGKNGKVTTAEAKLIANFVNVASGRGSVGRMASASAELAHAFFSFRFAVSRFQMIGMQPILKDLGTGSPRVRALIVKEYAKSLIGIGTVFGMASTALYAMMGPPSDDPDGWSIGFDWTSPDFGKLRIKDTRYDFLGGISQTSVFVGRMGTNVYQGIKKAFGGHVSLERQEAMKKTPTTIMNFAQSKVAPLAGTAIITATGRDFRNEDVTAASIAANMAVPISLRDIRDSLENNGVPRATANSLMTMLGMGVNQYNPKPITEEELKSLQHPWKAPKAKAGETVEDYQYRVKKSSERRQKIMLKLDPD